MQAGALRLLFYSQILFWVIPAALVMINSGMCQPASLAGVALSVVIWVVGGRTETLPRQSSLSPSPVPAASLGPPPMSCPTSPFLTGLTPCQLGELMGKWRGSAKKHQFRLFF